MSRWVDAYSLGERLAAQLGASLPSHEDAPAKRARRAALVVDCLAGVRVTTPSDLSQVLSLNLKGCAKYARLSTVDRQGDDVRPAALYSSRLG
jgi:hypothetical protein